MRLRGERGVALAVEAALVMPAVMAFVGMVIVLGGHALDVHALGAATSQAARTGSLERSDAASLRVAREAVVGEVAAAGVHCTDLRSSSRLVAEHGVRSVAVSVDCRLRLSIPGVSVSRLVHVMGTSPIDVLRSQ